MRVLVVEDNKRLSASLEKALKEDGYAVDPAYDGPSGEGMALNSPYDLIILDIMLPGKDGFAVCQSLRSRKLSTPILMLTARTAVDDKVKGLDSGADDYLPKPFELAELKARIRALLRRGAKGSGPELVAADLSLDPAAHRAQRAGTNIELTTREFALLEYLLRHKDQLVTREMVEAPLWNQEDIVVSNVVDVYIRRLRAKIDDPFEIKLLETVRGSGYRIHDPGEEQK